MDLACASALTTEPRSERAWRAAVDEVRAVLGGRSVDLAVLFVTHHHAGHLEALPGDVASELGARTLIGCTGEHVLGGDREVEGGPTLALFAAHLPGTRAVSFRAPNDGGLPPAPPVEDPDRASILLLGDPFSFPVVDYLDLVAERFPNVPVIGGMASGGMAPGQNLVFDANGVAEGGALGAVVEGDVEVLSVVSQGCCPVGRPWVVTAVEDNHVLQLGGKPALDVLMATMADMSEEDRTTFQNGPFIGVAVDASRSEFDRDDFLARGLLGADPRSKALAVGDHLRRGQTVQFLMRDARTAGDDIERLLARAAGRGCAGGVLFTCNGRGTRMFERPSHDVSHVQAALGPDLPLAGFFAMGEVGPVGPRAFLHGFTASMALFAPRR
ncbi:MAG: FIST N-terminal domain-containing protein [Planctomycetota bacterium]